MNLSTTNKLENPKRGKIYVAVAALVVALVVGLVIYSKMPGASVPVVSGLTSGAPLGSKMGTYWAVFLTNGQTYFGKLDPDNLNGSFINLAEVYYLDKAASPATGQGAAQTATPGYTLVHLGNELHGPTDAMIINRQSVLFIEQLKPDSKVVTTILSAKR